MKYILSTIILFMSLCACPQNIAEIDSLQNALKGATSDSDKIEIYLTLANRYRDSDSTKTHEYSLMAIRLAEKANFLEGKCHALYELGYMMMIRGDYDKADSLFNTCSSIASSIDYQKGIALALNGKGISAWYQGENELAIQYYEEAFVINNMLADKDGMSNYYSSMGIIYKEQGDYRRALDSYLLALKLHQEVKKEFNVAADYYNIGTIYRSIEDYSKAREYFLKALKAFDKMDNDRGKSYSLIGLGLLLADQEKYEQSLEYYDEALAINRAFGNKPQIAACYHYIGEAHKHLGDYETSLTILTKAIELSKSINADYDLPLRYLAIGQVYLAQNRYYEAKDMFAMSISLANKEKLVNIVRDARYELAIAESRQNNYEAAFNNYLLFEELKDSLFNEKVSNDITRLAAEYEFQQEKDSIAFINEKEKLVLTQKIESQKNAQYVTIAGLVILIIFSLTIYTYYRLRTRTVELLKEKNLEIERQSKELKEFNNSLEQKVRSRTEKIQEQNEKLREYAFSNSHIVRAPVAKILGYIEVLGTNQQLTKEEREELSSNLKLSAEQLDQVIREIGAVLSEDYTKD